MKVDISDLKLKNFSKKGINLEINKDSFFDGSENVAFSKPIKFNGFIRRRDEMFELIGEVTTQVVLNCSRCLKTFTKDLHLEINEQLSINGDDEFISINNDNIDIYEIIENSIIVELPVKRLCNEECKGLCQYCGGDLNHKQCCCDGLDVDPRLEKLKDLFSKA